MKKVLYALAAVGLLAAACNSSKPASPSQPAAEQQQGVAPSQPVASQKQAPAPATSDVKVNNVDDAVNAIEKNSSNEQTKVTASDDSDLTATDATDLNGLTEVPNGN